MPLPWKKKTKPNRISRIVADLQPPARAASLVVETGFPASVVDLFVKNRDRIKRHSLKKSKHKHSLLHSPEPMAAPPPTPSHDSPLLPAVHGLDDLLEDSAAATDVESNVVENAIASENENENEDSSVFDLAAKMLLAVAPVLSSTKLAVCIALFAFLLEILGQIAPRYFDLSSIQNRLRSTTKADAEQEIPPIKSDEIEIVESNSDHEQSSESFRETEIGCSSSSLGMRIEEERKLEMEKNEERSRSWKVRAKIMKKLIPKKLRKRNRTKELEEGSTTITENELSFGEEREEHEEEEEGIGSSTMGEQEQDERKFMNLESKIVIVMILLGLCVNRFLALVLALSGCFIFKFMIKSLYPKWS